jgi:hypothetical protein
MVPHSNTAVQSVAPERVFATLQPQQFSARLPSGERQLGDVGGDAARLVAGEQLRRRGSGLGTAQRLPAHGEEVLA